MHVEFDALARFDGWAWTSARYWRG